MAGNLCKRPRYGKPKSLQVTDVRSIPSMVCFPSRFIVFLRELCDYLYVAAGRYFSCIRKAVWLLENYLEIESIGV